VSTVVVKPLSTFECVEIGRVHEEHVRLDAGEAHLNNRSGILMVEWELEEFHMGHFRSRAGPSGQIDYTEQVYVFGVIQGSGILLARL